MNPASRAAAISPGTSPRTSWCTAPGRRVSARAASTARVAPPLYSRAGRQVNQFAFRSEYHSDDLTNKEIGWKTEFFDHRFQWNGAMYQENWDNVQIGFFDPGETGNLAFGTNGQNFRIRGIETSVVAVVFQGLTLQGAAAWNSSEQTNSPAADRPPPAIRSPRSATRAPAPIATAINNLFGPPACAERQLAAHSVQPARAL